MKKKRDGDYPLVHEESLHALADRISRLAQACSKVNEGLAEIFAIVGAAETEQNRDVHSLTEKQRQVLELISKDMGIADIAKNLKMAKRTAEVHQNTIRRKLGFPDAKALREYAKAQAKSKG